MKFQASMKKIILTLLILLLGIAASTDFLNRVCIDKTFLNRIDRSAETYLDRTMTKALITFAIVRGINAVISVVQDSDVAVSPAGVGVTVAVGEILDPLNDLIERFSWVMLASTTSLGLQRILMTIAAWLGFRVLLSIALLLLLIGIWFSGRFRFDMKIVGVKLIVLAVVVRFAIPLTAIATDRIDVLFLDGTYDRASQNLKQVSVEIDAGDIDVDESLPEDSEKSSGILQKAKSFFSGIKDAINVEQRVRSIKEKVTGYIAYIIDLIVVFILQTILIPLAVLWILLRLVNARLAGRLAEMIRGSKRAQTVGTQD